MHAWDSDPSFADLRQLAQRLEAALNRANETLLKAAGVGPEDVLDAFARVQGKMLGFDDHGTKRFHEALEEKRVKTLSQGSVVMTCVLSAAVALSEFKSQPRHTAGTAVERGLDRVRDKSTNGISLGLFALASFYGVLGKGAWRHLDALRRGRQVIKASR
jgi:hypothetical protein